MLKVKNLSLAFGGLTAVNDVSFSVKEGETFAVIGPNGAGKTSLFNAISGVYRPTAGDVLIAGRKSSLPFTISTALTVFVSALLTGCAAVLILNLTSLWDAVIINKFIYATAFDWVDCFWGSVAYLSAQNSNYIALPFLSGAAVGGLAALKIFSSTRVGPEVCCSFGLTRTFQNVRLFKDLSALDNVLIGLQNRRGLNFFSSLFHLPSLRKQETINNKRALELLALVGLEVDAERLATELPYGSQRKLEIARALGCNPKVLLLDEPAAGMNATEKLALVEIIKRIGALVTVILIEHDMQVVMGIADRILVLDYGSQIALGTPAEICVNPAVINAYLGTGLGVAPV